MSSSEETRNRYLGYEALIRATGTFFRLLGIFGVFLGIILILGSAALEQAGESFGDALIMALQGLGFIVAGVAFIFVGRGLRALDSKFGKLGGTILGIVGLAVVPLGTVLGICVLLLIWTKPGQIILSATYQQIVDETPHVVCRTAHIVFIQFFALVVFLLVSIVTSIGPFR